MKDFIDTQRTRNAPRTGSSRSASSCRSPRRATGATQRVNATRQRRLRKAQRDDVLMPQIEQVWQANMKVYGAHKVGRQLARQGTTVA